MVRVTTGIASLCYFRSRNRWLVMLLGLLLLLLAHGMALVFRIQPAVSLWFPPSGVATALTFWLGPTGVVLTWIASFIVAPQWGSDGWARFASITDAIEPLVAWFLYCRCFRGSLSLKSLQDAIAFVISVPLAACGTSAVLGTLALVAFGKMPLANVPASIPHWWLGNAIGAMEIAPAALLLLTPYLHRRGWVQSLEPIEPGADSIGTVLRHRWVEFAFVLASAVFFALFTVRATQVSVFVTLQFSLLSIIPVFWAVASFGVAGSVVTASFSVAITLLAYLLLYPNAVSLPVFPVSAELLYTHKLSLLLQSAIALVAGAAITERSTTQIALAVEQIKRAESETRAQLSEQLLEFNRSLTQANQQLQESEQRFRTLCLSAPVGIYLTDAQGHCIYVNDKWSELTQLSLEQAQGSGWSSALHPSDRYSVIEAWQNLVERNAPFNQQYRFLRPDGSTVWVNGEATALKDEAERIYGFIGTVSDVTERKQIELESQRNEAILKAFMAASPAVMALFDRDLRFIYANQALAKINELPLSEHLGRTLWEVLPEIAPQFAPMLLRILETQEPVLNLEFSGEVRPGVYRHSLANHFPVCLPNGEVLGIGVTATDISELKRVEAQLRQSEERLSLALKSAQAGIWQWFKADNRTFWSDENFRLMGYEPGRDQSNYENWLNAVHPDERERAQQAVNKAVESQSSLYFEYRVILPDGSCRWLVDIGQPTYDVHGNLDGMIGIQMDITQRKLAEAALQDSEERLRLALNAANQGLYDLNVQTGETIVTPEYARMLGYEPEEFQETNLAWRDRLHPDDVATVYQVYEEYVAGKRQEYRVEFRQRTKSNNWIWILSIGKIVSWDYQGKPLRMLGTHTDITERKLIEVERAKLLQREQAARQQAESASRMKDEFLAVVSHELRSPLNGILGWSRLLRTRNLDSATTEKALASIERNAQAQTQLIEDLLDISRIIRGTVRLNLRPVSLAPIVQAALDTVRPTASAKSIHLEAHLDFSIRLVSGDFERLQQIVWNLLSNAVKFTPEGGQVNVRLSFITPDCSEISQTEQATQFARIQVIDNGKGIKGEFLPHVFDRFRQADATTTRTQGGLGLGLAIVQNLAELHHGKVYAESAGEGQGATFTVELPLLPFSNDVDHENNDPLTTAGDPDSLAGLQVLIVDDEADTREFLVAAVEQFGAIATAVASAQEALAFIQQTIPDILLSDIGMPQEDGYSLIRKIRALPPQAGGQIPAAALTAYVRGNDRQAALAAGFQMHIPKPIEPVQLLNVITQLVGLGVRG